MKREEYMSKERFFAPSEDDYIYKVPADRYLSAVRLVSAMEMIVKITLPLAVSEDVVRTREYQDLVQIADWLAEVYGFEPMKGPGSIRPDEDVEHVKETHTLPF